MRVGELVELLRPTASALDVLAACPGSATLRKVAEASEWSQAGTAVHLWIELTTQAVADGVEREVAAEMALEQIDPEHRAAIAGIDIHALPIEGVAAEVALAWDVETGETRELGRGLSRSDYLALLGRHELGGILDAVGWDAETRTAVVIDYKTGWSEQSASSWQQRCYAHLAASWLGAVSVRTLIVRTRKGDPWYSSHTWDAFDIMSAGNDLLRVLRRAAAAMIRNGDPRLASLSMGTHCRYCPSARVCPAQTEQVVELANRDPEQKLAPMTPAELGWVWQRLEVAKRALDRMRDDIKRLATTTPIPVSDPDEKGRRRYLGEQPATRDMLDGDAAYQHLAATYGPDAAEMVAPPSPRSATWAAVGKLARELKAAGKFSTNKSAEQAIRDELHEVGAATRRHYAPVKEYWAKPCPTCGEGQAMNDGPCTDCTEVRS